MKQLARLAVTMTMLFVYSTLGQEVPKGVRYKPASDAVNTLARSILEQALADPATRPSDLFDDVAVCGPMLWKSLKPSADKTLLGSMPVIMLAQVPEPIKAEARRIITKEERESFWRAFAAKYPKLKGATVRKGKAEEISFYWATIPFDIEEPFYVIDTGSERFVAHFQVKNGKPRLFWLDLVGDLRTLKS